MLENFDDVEQLMKAIKFASEKHSQQRRKDGKETPYINHPIAVAELLCTVGKVRDADILIAAVLHDTIEDTDTNPDEIEREFGAKVAAMVLECTDDKSLPKAERKRLQIVNASHKSPGAKQIKIADKTNNVFCLYTSPPRDWSMERRVEYLDWSEKVVAGLKGINAELDDCYARTLTEARTMLSNDSDH